MKNKREPVRLNKLPEYLTAKKLSPEMAAKIEEIEARHTPERLTVIWCYLRDRTLALSAHGYQLVETHPRGLVVIRPGGLRVILDATVKADGQVWAHASCSRENRHPDYKDMTTLYREVLGATRPAVQVFVPPDQHINLMTNVYHLYMCLTADPLPDFSEGLGTI